MPTYSTTEEFTTQTMQSKSEHPTPMSPDSEAQSTVTANNSLSDLRKQIVPLNPQQLAEFLLEDQVL